MNEMVLYLLVVLACFFGIALFIYICLKIYQLIVHQKSRNYHDMMEAQRTDDGVEMRGEYMLVTSTEAKPHLFGRSYKFKIQDHEKAKSDDKKSDTALDNSSDLVIKVTEGNQLNDCEKTTVL